MVLPAVVIIPSVQVVVLPGQKVAVPATSGRIFKEVLCKKKDQLDLGLT
jgi:hypothetical protein